MVHQQPAIDKAAKFARGEAVGLAKLTPGVCEGRDGVTGATERTEGITGAATAIVQTGQQGDLIEPVCVERRPVGHACNLPSGNA
jgi:hypothetical protein